MKVRRYTQRANYWSHSKLARWIKQKAGIDKRTSGTLMQHKEWHDKSRSEHPIVYWITEEGFSILQNTVNFIPDYVRAYRNYFLHKFVYKHHTLPTGLDPGDFIEYDYRLLYGMFGLLVDYVEVDCALMAERSNRNRWLELLTLTQWRSKNLGVSVLIEEAVSNHGTRQGNTAKEILELYMWWTSKRPNRVDMRQEDTLEKYDSLDIYQIAEDLEKNPPDYAAQREIAEHCDAEDTEMMYRLVKVRHAMWN